MTDPSQPDPDTALAELLSAAIKRMVDTQLSSLRASGRELANAEWVGGSATDPGPQTDRPPIFRRALSVLDNVSDELEDVSHRLAVYASTGQDPR